MPVDIENLSTEDIINLYPEILKELKKRKIIETNNLVGEIGQFLSREHYNKNTKLPNLDPAPVGTKHIDAISRKGERYSIKSASSGVTGNFFGLEPPESKKKQQQLFEYVVIVTLGKNYDPFLENIYEINWDQFLKVRKWHQYMGVYNVPVNATLKEIAKKIL